MTVGMAAFILTAGVGRAMQPSAADANDELARQAAAAYARCIVKKNDAQAWSAVVDHLSNKEVLKRYPRLKDNDCVDARKSSLGIDFPEGTLVSALAGALFERDLTARPAMDFSGVNQLAQPPISALDEASLPKDKVKAREMRQAWDHELASSFLSRYGECVVRSNPAAAHDLLASKEGSIQEGAAFTALQTALGTCLPPGQTIEFEREQLRDSIAVNYVRLAAAASPDLPPAKDD